MSRYFTMPRANYVADEEPPYSTLLPDLCVPDHRPINTGLVNHRGDPIMRVPNPVGFHRP